MGNVSRSWWLLFLLSWVLRLGEAAHPGPRKTQVTSGPLIGCLNPTGLLNKGPQLAELPIGTQSIWAVSETHLTRIGKQKCTDQLRYHEVGLTLQAGAAVPPRSATVSAVGGKHRGVAFLSSVPSRQMSPTWPSEAWEEARFHVASFAIGRRWIQGGVIYGHAVHPNTIQTKADTNAICSHVNERLVNQSVGLRFVAGDFNQPHLGIEAMQHWTDLGWINVQVWAMQKLGKPVRPTCKGATTVDHIFLSPELSLYLSDVLVDESYFSDHAILAALLTDLGRPPMMPLWRHPKPMPWKSIPDVSEVPVAAESAETPDAQYRLIMQSLESCVDHQLQAAGHPKMHPKQRGRAATTEVHWVAEYSTPPRLARQGELQPQFHGIDPTHGKWIRQGRRLWNLSRNLTKATTTPTAHLHNQQLWQSIISAAGFSPTFLSWWNTTCGHAATLTHAVPSSATMQLVAKTFESELRTMEKLLNLHRVTKAKQRRLDDPNVIFADLRKESPKPCQTLLHKAQAQVVYIDADDMSITLEPPQPWKVDEPLHTTQGLVNVVHAEPDRLWLDQDPTPLQATQVKQEHAVGHITDMFQAFQKEWSERWDKHLHVDESFWDPIVDFAKTAFVPPPPMELHPITFQRWRQELKKKSRRAASGPDAVTREDLLRMPQALTEQLLQILSDVEAGKPWPNQMIQGWVIALEKLADPSGVNHYRPITIFSIAYRTWSSIRSKEIIQHLEALAPASCTGNLPHRSAQDVWYRVLGMIEASHHTGQELSGAVLDLVKCFNLLPRFPTLKIMEHFNVDRRILTGWASAQCSMRRRFKLRSCTGPPVGSSTGFAEGCGLSVTAMLALNIVAHKWLSMKAPTITLYTFVDNLELVCPNANAAIQGLEELLKFTEVLDVVVDHDKTYVWSSQPTGRKTFRQEQNEAFQYTIKYHARDLGGHMAYSKRHTNSTIVDRLQATPELWNRLARSLAPYAQKLRSLRTKAWPMALHGIPAATVADNHFSTLRTGAVRGLKEHSNGTSPIAHLSLVEHPLHDPQFYALQSTAVMFRMHGPSPEDAAFVWRELHHPFLHKQAPPGPCGTLLARLHNIGWMWIADTRFLDHAGLEIDVIGSPIQELKSRLCEGWQRHALGVVQQRKTFKGSAFMHPGLTVSCLKKWEPEKQALLRTALNGTFFTADHLKHRQEEQSSKCKFCGAEDSQIHRHWHCEFFTSCRRHLTKEQIDLILDMPGVVANHGWVPEPPSLHQFRKLCLELPDETTQFVWPSQVEAHLHLFTDGSCLAPANATCRLASWGVVVGSVSRDTFLPLTNGLLPGWIQTAARAEIMAAISALEFVNTTQKPATLWVDNDRVYKKLRLFQRGFCRISPNQRDADLWTRLAAQVLQAGKLFQHVIKVVSHQDPQGAQDELENWIFRGNAAADALAAQAFTRFPTMMQAWQVLHKDVAAVCLFREQLHKVLVQVGSKSFTASQLDAAPSVDMPAPRLTREDIHEFRPTLVDPTTLTKRWVFPEASQVIEWFCQLYHPESPVRALSWFQLSILFERQTQLPGIEYKASCKKYNLAERRTRKNFVKRTNNFSRWVQGVFPACKPIHLKPCSTPITFWTMCAALRVRDTDVEMMDQLLSQHQRTYTQVRQLRDI